MNLLRTKANPAFKRTQPLPMLPVDFARRAGWAARSFAQALPLAGSWPAVAVQVAGAVVRPGLKLAPPRAAG